MTVDSGVTHESDGKAIIMFESLLCLLREKNILTRADLEHLTEIVADRVTAAATGPLPCCPQRAAEALSDIRRVTGYIGHRFGGKRTHRFVF